MHGHKTQDPTKINRIFIGWYQDSALTIPFSFDTDKITAHTTLYAGWSVIWRKVLAKTYHTVGIRTDGTLWTWGNNDEGQLGLGDDKLRFTPTIFLESTNIL